MTITRWILKGSRRVDGTIVRIRATRIGYRWLIRQADLDDFIATLSAVSNSLTSAPPARSPGARQKAFECAGDKLKRMGA